MKRKKDYSKTVRSVAGKKSKAKIDALHKMVEALIADRSEDAEIYLHEYLTAKVREILEKKSEDADSDVDTDDEVKDEDMNDEDDDDDEDEGDEDEKEDDDSEKDDEDEDDESGDDDSK